MATDKQSPQNPSMPMQGSSGMAAPTSRAPMQSTQGAPTGGVLPTPFTLMRRLSDEMDRIFEEYSTGRPSASMGQSFLERLLSPGMSLPHMAQSLGHFPFHPQLEIFEKGDRLVVRADLPGLERDDVRVELMDDALVLEGERRVREDVNERGMMRSERAYGRFRRVIPLPPNVNPDTAQVSFRNGVLEIAIDLTKGPRGRRLEIRDENVPGGGGTSRRPVA